MEKGRRDEDAAGADGTSTVRLRRVRWNGWFGAYVFFRNQPSEFLLAANARRVGKVAIEGEEDVLNLRIHHVVQALDRVGTRRNMVKGRLHLRHVLELDGDMKVAELRRLEA